MLETSTHMLRDRPRGTGCVYAGILKVGRMLYNNMQ